VWLDLDISVGQPLERSLPNIMPPFDRIAMRPSAVRSLEGAFQEGSVRG